MRRKPSSRLNRRDLLKLGAVGAGGLAIQSMAGPVAHAVSGNATMIDFAAPPLDRVRIGFVGVGLMGTAHVENFLKIEGVDVVAVCDIVEEKVVRAQKMVVDAGQPLPEGFSRGPEDFERLCDRADLDLVFTATPWEWHVPVCIAAMNAGKHAATEVPAALTIDDCWRLVETSERTRRHCVMMENCNYDRFEMLTLNMVNQGMSRRTAPCRVRLPARPAGGEARHGRGGRVASGTLHDDQRRSLPDAWSGPGGAVFRHQSWQHIRNSGFHGFEDPRPPPLCGGDTLGRTVRKPRKYSCSRTW